MFVGRSQRDGEITGEERDAGGKITEGRKVWLGKMVGESLQRKLRSGARWRAWEEKEGEKKRRERPGTMWKVRGTTQHNPSIP